MNGREYLQGVWYGARPGGILLAPLGWLYGAIAGLRRRLYTAGHLHATRIARPVVVVGNLTVGGTGKTPLVLWLVAALRGRGLRPGIVSRGYGGAGGPARRVTEAATAEEVGDEPRLLARRAGVPVAVGRERAAAAALLAPDVDLVIADDGLQHYALARDLEIAVIDGTRGLGNGRLLPAGPLREGRARLRDVDFVVVNGGGGPSGSLAMHLGPTAIVRLTDGARESVADWRGRRVHAVAGIGNPARYFATLAAAGLETIEHPLPDHVPYAGHELEFGDGLPVLMTEKDAVKYQRWARPEHWYLEVEAVLEEADAKRLVTAIVDLFAGRRTGLPTLE